MDTATPDETLPTPLTSPLFALPFPIHIHLALTPSSDDRPQLIASIGGPPDCATTPHIQHVSPELILELPPTISDWCTTWVTRHQETLEKKKVKASSSSRKPSPPPKKSQTPATKAVPPATDTTALTAQASLF